MSRSNLSDKGVLEASQTNPFFPSICLKQYILLIQKRTCFILRSMVGQIRGTRMGEGKSKS